MTPRADTRSRRFRLGVGHPKPRAAAPIPTAISVTTGHPSPSETLRVPRTAGAPSARWFSGDSGRQESRRASPTPDPALLADRTPTRFETVPASADVPKPTSGQPTPLSPEPATSPESRSGHPRPDAAAVISCVPSPVGASAGARHPSGQPSPAGHLTPSLSRSAAPLVPPQT